MNSASPPSSPPSDETFDATFWKAVNAALDEALECDEVARPAFVKQLHLRDPRLAQEVRKLLGRAHSQTLATNVVRHASGRPIAGMTTQLSPVLGESGESISALDAGLIARQAAERGKPSAPCGTGLLIGRAIWTASGMSTQAAGDDRIGHSASIHPALGRGLVFGYGAGRDKL